ncbi:hypothetical protein AOQ84DRAFT_134953 [Glonium stellatum]|uniref:Ubiquitin 3 binding protein But2 C-terminal domain-containing protein n=1 Tax=Glonium stellatum TaxID=574774 RepID=A0A8E2F9M6_9PEZI|nr:hypothetical protein AOQ84DRAFT_134953 [Glonium stellatum]
MKSLALLPIIFTIAFSSPFPLEIISSRSLSSRGLSCPPGGTLPSSHLNPTLMVPIAASAPNHAFGGTQTPIITPNDFCTIFDLSIPPSGVGKTCTLEFLFPALGQTLTPYVYIGEGHFTFTGYAFGSGATEETTYNNQPPAGPSPPTPPSVLAPGHAYTINVGPCGIQPGASSLEVSGKLCSNDTTFSYYQNDNKCPIGFFVTIS